jgi:hypothetical protein
VKVDVAHRRRAVVLDAIEGQVPQHLDIGIGGENVMGRAEVAVVSSAWW